MSYLFNNKVGFADNAVDAFNRLKTGGSDIIGGYISSSGAFVVNDVNDFNFQLGRTQTGVSDTIVLTLTPLNAGSKICADFSWFEIV